MSPSLVTEVTGIVLAGGKSKRFGKDKAFLNIKGTPLINRVISVMKQVFQKVILIANEPDKYLKIGLPVFSDVIKDLGPIGGILTGILHMQTKAGFFVACDMPFLNPALIRYMVEIKNGFDVVIPKIGKNIEPLHAIYTKRCIPYIRRCIANKKYSIRSFFPYVSIRYVEKEEIVMYDPEIKFLININQPTDIRRFDLDA